MRRIVKADSVRSDMRRRALAKGDNNGVRQRRGGRETSESSSADSVAIAPIDEAKGEQGDEDFAQNTDNQGTPTLANQILEVGAESDAGECGKEGPARQV